MDYLVLWVHVTKHFVLCHCQEKRKKNACVLQPIIIYLQVVVETSVHYHMG